MHIATKIFLALTALTFVCGTTFAIALLSVGEHAAALEFAREGGTLLAIVVMASMFGAGLRWLIAQSGLLLGERD